MSRRDELIKIIKNRFSGVPMFGDDDAESLIDDAIYLHSEDSSTELLLLYAQYQGAWKIAIGTAYYFKFSDGEESIDRTATADNYRKLASDFKKLYDKESPKGKSGNFRVMSRLDRPNTSPPSGNSGRRGLWRRY